MKITKERLREIVKEVIKEESEYQKFFKAALEKTGKSIPQMSDEEKKKFFDKIDAAWSAKGEKNEGNAFGAAVTKAKEQGEDHFEVGGKTYKVESVNEDVALSRLNSIQDAREKMISFISYKKANGKNKPDSWYDRTEKSLSNKSYKDLEKLYLNLGGKKIKIESVNEYDEWRNTRIQSKNIFRMLKQKYNNNIPKMKDGLEDIIKKNKTKNDQAEVIRGEFNKYFKLKEEVNEGASSEELRMAKNAVKNFARYRRVPGEEAIYDLMRAVKAVEQEYKKNKKK